MLQDLPLFPPQASTYAAREDALFFFLVAVTVFFVSLIFLSIIVFAIRYRRRSPKDRPRPTREPLALELTWSLIPLGLAVVMFVWGAYLYFFASRPPASAMEIAVVGKQWMWRVQHPDGPREINELHVPLGRPVKLTMTSEDVIHSFFVPAFRIKRDVVPGRYVTAWFEATRTGEYHLFCSQYCGTQHSGMIGRVVVMEPAEYEQWLRGGGASLSLAAQGEILFRRLACAACHRPDNTGRGPSLVGLFGRPVKLEGGGTATADEAYIRESILLPQAKTVAGFPPIMPTFKGQISEEGILQLIAYIKSLTPVERAKATP